MSSLDEDDETKCRAMLKRLGLVYGAFDFVRTPTGELGSSKSIRPVNGRGWKSGSDSQCGMRLFKCSMVTVYEPQESFYR